MKKQGHYMFDIRKVGNWVGKIFTKEIFVKYCKIYYLTEPVMASITVNVEEIRAVALFNYDNCEMDNKIIHMEVSV